DPTDYAQGTAAPMSNRHTSMCQRDTHTNRSRRRTRPLSRLQDRTLLPNHHGPKGWSEVTTKATTGDQSPPLNPQPWPPPVAPTRASRSHLSTKHRRRPPSSVLPIAYAEDPSNA